MLHHSNASLCGRLFTLLFLLLTGLAAGPGAFGAHPADKTEEPKKAVVTVGVQSSLEPVFFTGSFGPTMAYLRKTFPELEFRSEVLGDDALLLSIESSGFDFVFMDSGFYVFSADQVEMRDIVMQTSPQSANPAESVGSAVIVRADEARFRRIDDLRGRSVAADSPESLGGWNILQGVIRERGYDPGDAWSADTLEELAEKMMVDPAVFKKTIEDFNAGVDARKDALGKAPDMLRKIERAPFYAGYAGMSCHHTMGGIVINKKTQVLDRRGNVIPHLHAVGELTGDIHGTNRLGGKTICDIFTFGRLTGIHVAKGE